MVVGWEALSDNAIVSLGAGVLDVIVPDRIINVAVSPFLDRLVL